MNTKVIDLKDYFAECIRKVWIILICITMLMGIMVVYSKNSDESANSKQIAASIEEIEQGLTATDWAVINDYLEFYDAQTQKQTYSNESIYMKLNPYEVPVTCIQYYVKPVNPEVEAKNDIQSTTVAYSLYNHLRRGGMAKYFKDNYDSSIDLQYYQELIIIDNYSDGIITYSIYYPDLEVSKELAELSLSSFKEEEEKLRNEGFQFESNVISENSGIIAIDSMRVYQDNVRGGLNTNKSAVTTKWNAMTDDQKAVAGSKLGQKYVANELVFVNTLQKFVIIGIIVGLILGMVVVFILYYGSGKIKVDNETEREDGIEQLGCQINQRRNKFEEMADKLFYSKRNKSIKKELNVAKIISSCNKKNIKDLGIIGIKEDNIKTYYIEELGKNGINVICVDGVDTVENIENISRVDTVMFFEYLRETDYITVENILKFCNNRKMNILGYISVVR